MSVQSIPPQTPLLYSKTGVCRGIPIFLIFAPKHRLWVLVRTASPIYVLSKNKKNIEIFQMKFSIFIGEKNLYILHGQVFVMSIPSDLAAIIMLSWPSGSFKICLLVDFMFVFYIQQNSRVILRQYRDYSLELHVGESRDRTRNRISMLFDLLTFSIYIYSQRKQMILDIIRHYQQCFNVWKFTILSFLSGRP